MKILKIFNDTELKNIMQSANGRAMNMLCFVIMFNMCKINLKESSVKFYQVLLIVNHYNASIVNMGALKLLKISALYNYCLMIILIATTIAFTYDECLFLNVYIYVIVKHKIVLK